MKNILTAVFQLILLASCYSNKSPNEQRQEEQTLKPPSVVYFNTMSTAMLVDGEPQKLNSGKSEVTIAYSETEKNITISVKRPGFSLTIPFSFARSQISNTEHFSDLTFIGVDDKNEYMEVAYIFKGSTLSFVIARLNRNTNAILYENTSD